MQPYLSSITDFQSTLPELARFLSDSAPYALWETSREKHDHGSFVSHQPDRFAYLTVRPRSAVSFRAGTLCEFSAGRYREISSLRSDQDPFSILAELYDFLGDNQTVSSQAGEPNTPFPGGLLGFVSYDAARAFERIRGTSDHPTQPDLFFIETTHLLIHDRQLGLLTILSRPSLGADEAGHDALVAEIGNVPRSVCLERRSSEAATLDFKERFSKAEFAARVEQALEYIRAGDIFQVVLSNQFTVKDQVDPLRAYSVLRAANPSPYHFLVHYFNETIVGASPEVMLQGGPTESGRKAVRMRLVAGTYPKGDEDDLIVTQAETLGEDSKELAEHLMLVDHARNDIGRVSQIGTVEVADLFSIETYADVHHLVSQVGGELRPTETVMSALRSCFPIATLTGTPKIRAMEIIAELEGPYRGIFGGAIVALGIDGSIDSAVAIRSLVTGPAGTSVQAGAGIVYDSSPEREYEECRWKARALFNAIAESRL
ncbi:MAG: anthranilate synthase component I family protein [Bdellovibrionota bacterium]